MCIILGAMFEMTFDDSMDTAKDLYNMNITLVVHQSQIVNDGLTRSHINSRSGKIKEFEIFNEACSWISTINETNDDDCAPEDECCWIKKLVDNQTYKEANDEGIEELKYISLGLSPMDYEEIIKYGLLEEGKFSIMKSYLTQPELRWGELNNKGMGWHRSEDMVHGINPSKGYLTNKKWIFNEDITIFIFIFFTLGIFCFGGGLNAEYSFG